MQQTSHIFATSAHRTAWNIAAKHLARGQKDPVQMVQEGIEHERKRCIDLLQASGVSVTDIPVFLSDPDASW
jgi:hypothetical protein